MSVTPPLLAIVGPTGSGKTALALALAQQLKGEIISADSMQVYRECDIVTAKPTSVELASAPHHLIDVVNPDERFGAGEFASRARDIIEAIYARGNTPILCGGTGFYLRALLHPETIQAGPANEELRGELEARYLEEGPEVLWSQLRQLNPEVAAKVHANDRYRVVRALEIALSPVPKQSAPAGEATSPSGVAPAYRAVALDWPRDELYSRLDQRVLGMLEAGALDELSALRAKWGADAPALGGVGYKQLAPALDGQWPLTQAVEDWQRDTRRYAKRQLTWFRHQMKVHWIAGQLPLNEQMDATLRYRGTAQ